MPQGARHPSGKIPQQIQPFPSLKLEVQRVGLERQMLAGKLYGIGRDPYLAPNHISALNCTQNKMGNQCYKT